MSDIGSPILRNLGNKKGAKMSNKTTANKASVNDFIDGLDDPVQRADSRKLLQIFSDITGARPVMWGTALIGFGSVDLTYASGRHVQWLQVGFSPRKGKISLYVTFDAVKLTSKFPDLGTYKTGKGCIYIRRLADIDLDELHKLIQTAWQTGYEQPVRSDGKEQIKNFDK
ncbi:MAG TPA: DUF1801 domain-containing protein [Candidatus Saccharimonadales bacterium]|nr:DUF1801 domain-containing protein [Candidatus Saccharimonadales bacterium]